MEEKTGLQLLFELCKQLSQETVLPQQKIPTATIDSIFFEIETDLEAKIRENQLSDTYLESQLQAFAELISSCETALKDLNAVEFLNHDQFYRLLRLKKIYGNLRGFLRRYEAVAAALTRGLKLNTTAFPDHPA